MKIHRDRIAIETRWKPHETFLDPLLFRPQDPDPAAHQAQQLILWSIATRAALRTTLEQICRYVDDSCPGLVSGVVAVDENDTPQFFCGQKWPADLGDRFVASSAAELLRLDLTDHEPMIVKLTTGDDDSQDIRYWPLMGADGLSLGTLGFYARWSEQKVVRLRSIAVPAAHFPQTVLEQDRAANQISRFMFDERRMIAERLHDDPVQAIAAASLILQRVALDVNPEQAAAVSTARRRVDDAGRKLRKILFELHPLLLGEVGLIAVLETYLEEVFEDFATTWSVRNEIDTEPDQATSLLAFRFIQEALANVVKHSAATHVEVVVRTSDSLEVHIIDDGVGFDVGLKSSPVAGHLGRSNIEALARRLAGTVEYESSPGNGCTVNIELPLAALA